MTFDICQRDAGELGKFKFPNGRLILLIFESTWPAVWEVAGPRWPIGVYILSWSSMTLLTSFFFFPHQGEIDILEGVNDQSPNAATLHTTEGSKIFL